MHMNTEISGMAQLHLKGVVLWRDGYQIKLQMTAIMIIW